MAEILKADPEPYFTWLGGSPANEPLPCRVNLAEDNPLPQKWGRALFGGLFLNGRLDSVEDIKNYGAVCEFPLAHGHDMQKKKKEKKKGMKTLFIILFL